MNGAAGDSSSSSGASAGNVRVYFLRHAESRNNARGPGEARQGDPPITELGKAQAEAVGEFLLQRGIYDVSQIFVSPMRRTLLTARPLIRMLLGLHKKRSSSSSSPPSLKPITVLPLICENGGVFEGERHGSELTSHLHGAETSSAGVSKDSDSALASGSADADDDSHGLKVTEMIRDVLLSSHEGAAEEECVRSAICFARPCGEAQGWWTGGRETDEAYAERCKSICEWIQSLEKSALLITHGKLMDGILKEIVFGCEGRAAASRGDNVVFLTGGCAMSCIEMERQTGRVSVCFLNQPVVPDKSIRTGHAISGFTFGNEW